jgi:hypothetical protein
MSNMQSVNMQSINMQAFSNIIVDVPMQDVGAQWAPLAVLNSDDEMDSGSAAAVRQVHCSNYFRSLLGFKGCAANEGKAKLQLKLQLLQL